MNNKNTSARGQGVNPSLVRLTLHEAVTEALNSTLAIDLPPLDWTIRPDGTWSGAFLERVCSDNESARALQDWASRYELTRASAQDTTPGAAEYRGSIVGRRVEIWAITDRDAFDKVCGR